MSLLSKVASATMYEGSVTQREAFAARWLLHLLGNMTIASKNFPAFVGYDVIMIHSHACRSLRERLYMYSNAQDRQLWQDLLYTYLAHCQLEILRLTTVILVTLLLHTGRATLATGPLHLEDPPGPRNSWQFPET